MLYDYSMTDYSRQKKYFETAYKTGSDIWTGIPFEMMGGELIEKLPQSAMILDLGSGRGRFPFTLAEAGFRVIGLEYVSELIQKNNEEVRNKDLETNLRFVEGSVLDIPFSDSGFDAVIDVGLLQHIHPEDWPTYRNEIVRVLKPGAYYFLITLSRETLTYLSWHPKNDKFGDFEKDGVFYHFFTEEELRVFFETDFEILTSRIELVPAHHDVSYMISLLKRK